MNQPRLRFKEFKGEIKNRKLEKLAKFSKGKGYSKNHLIKKGTPIILYGSMYTNYETIITNSNCFVNSSDNDKVSKSGDVIVPASGETAIDISRASAILSDGIILGGDLNVISPNNEIIGEFLAYYLSFGNRKYKIARLAQGKTIVHIHNSDLEKLEINYPDVEEQYKIVNYFSNLDQLIELQSDKLEHLKRAKQGYLQKMFPSILTELPQIRFNEFNIDWKNFKLKNLLFETKLKQDLTPYSHRLLTVKLHFEGIKPTSKYPRVTQKGRKYYFRHAGEIIIGKQNFQNGGFGIAGKDVDGLISSSAIMSLNVTNLANKYFIYHAMTNRNWLRETTRYLNGTGQKEYGTKTFMNLKIKIPSLPEQKCIGQFLSQLDHLIDLQKQKIYHLKRLKQAYLQKMFI